MPRNDELLIADPVPLTSSALRERFAAPWNRPWLGLLLYAAVALLSYGMPMLHVRLAGGAEQISSRVHAQVLASRRSTNAPSAAAKAATADFVQDRLSPVMRPLDMLRVSLGILALTALLRLLLLFRTVRAPLADLFCISTYAVAAGLGVSVVGYLVSSLVLPESMVITWQQSAPLSLAYFVKSGTWQFFLGSLNVGLVVRTAVLAMALDRLLPELGRWSAPIAIVANLVMPLAIAANAAL